MTRSTFVLPEAQHDIREAALWYELREPDLGLRFVREVRSSLESIAENSCRFPTVEKDVRRALVKDFPYSIYFLTNPHDVTIIGVLHQHRRPGMWRKRR
jgi:toxin ParE1/3/4